MTLLNTLPPLSSMTGLVPAQEVVPSDAWRVQGQSWLPSLWRDKAKLWALLGALLDQVQELEDVKAVLLSQASLTEAEGKALDAYGARLGWARRGRGETSYRRELLACAQARGSAASYRGLVRVLDRLTGGETPVELSADVVAPEPGTTPAPPEDRPSATSVPFVAQLVVCSQPLSCAEGARFAELLGTVAPAGTRVRWEYDPLGCALQEFDDDGSMLLLEPGEDAAARVLPEAASGDS